MQHRPYHRGGRAYGGGRGGFGDRGGRGFSGRGGGGRGFGTFTGGLSRRSLNVNVFFTGVSLNVEKNTVRQHFESVGHVLAFRIFDPKPNIDYRHGLVEYMDERTASDAIARLNGTMIGDRAIRVAEAKERGKDLKLTKRKREGGPYGADGAGRKEGMTFPRGFQDPVLGRSESIVFDILKSMSTEDAYEAVEQLRVLALERRRDARALLQDNPALRSAVVMILQHAGRLPSPGGSISGATGTLPPEAFQSPSASGYGDHADDDDAPSTTGGVNAAADANAAQKKKDDGREGGGEPAAKRVTTEADREASKAALEQQRDEVMEIIGAMSEEDVDKILTMTSEDLAQVDDPAQRQQLEVLRDRLIEMSSEL